MAKIGEIYRVWNDALDILPFSCNPDTLWKIVDIDGENLFIQRVNNDNKKHGFIQIVTENMLEIV